MSLTLITIEVRVINNFTFLLSFGTINLGRTECKETAFILLPDFV